jgi:two-component system, LuxR family, response regulator DctR
MNIDPSLGLPMVYLVDDEDIIRDSLSWLLRSRRLLSEGFSNADQFEALLSHHIGSLNTSRVPWPTSPSCLVLDVRMPGTSGLVLFERLVARQIHFKLPVIFLTGHADVPMAVSAVKQGAFDFVEKPFTDNSLVDRIERALELSAQRITNYKQESQTQRKINELTDREVEVMRLILEGKPNKVIAEDLNISVRTVEVHRSRLFDKMQVRSAVELLNLLQSTVGLDILTPKTSLV